MGKADIVVNEIIEQLNTKDRAERCAIFIWGVMIYALAFSIFFSPRNIVTGGSTGLSIIFKDVFNIANTCRISLSFYNTRYEVDLLINVLKNSRNIWEEIL